MIDSAQWDTPKPLLGSTANGGPRFLGSELLFWNGEGESSRPGPASAAAPDAGEHNQPPLSMSNPERKEEAESQPRPQAIAVKSKV